MAEPSPMKRFYALFGLIAAVGIGFLIWQMNKASTPAVPVTVTVQPGDTAGFNGYVLGSDSAPVVITEYADYQCPACQQFATVEWPYVRDRLVQTGRVRWVFRDFPLQQHQWARLAAHSAACASEQGKFWEYQDAIFATQPDWSAQPRRGKDLPPAGREGGTGRRRVGPVHELAQVRGPDPGAAGMKECAPVSVPPRASSLGVGSTPASCRTTRSRPLWTR